MDQSDELSLWLRVWPRQQRASETLFEGSALMRIIRRVVYGVRRKPLRLLAGWFLGFTVLWTFLDPALALFPSLQNRLAGAANYLALIALSLPIGIWRATAPDRARFKVKTTNTLLDISFGDLFKSPGCKVIPVNEYFDSELGELVSPKSLHGQLLRDYFGGHPAAFNALVDEDLKSQQYEEVGRTLGRTRRYGIGTTAVVSARDERFLLVAFCKTDLTTLKASADVPELWTALSGLWRKARICAGGDTISVPLIGGGLSGLGLPSAQLLQLLLISVVRESKREHIANEIHVVLPEACLDEIDLRPIKQEWS
jgi:hypothetical protein